MSTYRSTPCSARALPSAGKIPWNPLIIALCAATLPACTYQTILGPPPPSGDPEAIARYEIANRPGTLHVWVLDVNQSSSTLIVTPSREHAILVDAGDRGIGSKVIIPVFQELESAYGTDMTLDPFVLTHYDADHIGGAPEVIFALEPGRVLDHGDHDYWLRKKGVTMKRYDEVANADPISLDFDETIDGVRIECLASNNRTDFDEPGRSLLPDRSGDNPNSVALLVSFDGWELYVAGDQTGSTERILAPHVPDIDVMVLNHHGSGSHGSNGIELLEGLSPEVAVASQGTKYDHPNADSVERARTVGADVFVTNTNKRSLVTLDPRFVADDDSKGFGPHTLIVVDPDEGNYYVVLEGMPMVAATYQIER